MAIIDKNMGNISEKKSRDESYRRRHASEGSLCVSESKAKFTYFYQKFIYVFLN